MRGDRVGIGGSHAFECEGEMGLFEIIIATDVAAAKARGLGDAFAALGEGREQRMPRFHQRVVIDRARGDQHHGARAVVLRHVSHEVAARKPRDGILAAEDRPAHRLVRITGLLKQIENEIVGRVARLTDFLDDDLALARQLAFLEGGIEQDIGDHI